MDGYFDRIAGPIAPQGRVGVTDDPEILDFRPLKTESVSIRREPMLARPPSRTPDMARRELVPEGF